MPMYSSIRRFKERDRRRTCSDLLRLREQLRHEVPRRTARKTLLLATWNIRDFDSNKFNHGLRLPSSLFYIAEIISAFDIVAVQEIDRDLAPFQNLMRLLGPSWDYIATDVTMGRSGNNERIVYVFDRNKVWFRNVAGEIVLPRGEDVDEQDRQFARTPFYVSFQSGWFKFSLCSVHIYYGKTSGAPFERRVAEIDTVARVLGKRAEEDDENIILLGDFNVVSPDDRTGEALSRNDWLMPNQFKTNVLQSKYYDQIAFRVRPDELIPGKSDPNAGAFYFFDSVLRDDEWADYYETIRAADLDSSKWGDTDDSRKKYYLDDWRTWQISDHLPLWVELEIDFAEPYLRRVGGL